ncbi:fasciclin domain-containing protein [Aquimarina sp. BL5]|uniref:fasciclin domain-containing protein n=1 Tax=Aquimarina sp. BL5 TaxID=1714860 RepID=UPI000E47017A|nr:fasciclin domain-containing protein [Aquimarina sp. BL5]AXT53012.1 fasciclin domain-containing protein [Aquimarina sp. BL5]RKN07339.1 fasciclin domain-containing protein [Aquimarina sp. BL5]
MKTLIQRLTVPFLCLFVTSLLVSCQTDNNELDQSNPDQIQFEESKIISFDEIEEMTQNIIDGELSEPENDGKSFSDSKNSRFDISRERRVYDFSATVNSGAGAGTEIEGELRLHFTLYHASFTIVRGNLLLPDGTRARARGAIVSDGIVYLIINPPGRGFIFGIGRVNAEGNLQGGFRIFGNGIGRGEWSAELIEITFPDKTIVDLIVEDGRFTSLVGALQATDLVAALSGEGPFTVFAPTDEAFAALDEVPELEVLKQVLLYHVASGRFNTPELLVEEMITTLQGEDVKVSLNENNEIVINDTVKLLSANIGGSNGVIQIIDAVLIPPSFQPLPSIVEIAVATPELSTLVGALQAANLVDTLNGEGPFTVFAPTNDAFDALDAIPQGDALTEVLLYHVAAGKFTAEDLLSGQTVTTVQGDEVTIQMIDGDVFLNGNIKVSIADIEASNGIVHVIDGVLLTPADLQSIVEIAVATPELSILVGALQAANLVDTLNGEGPFTVFAPTNDAFDALEAIPEGDALTEVLLYHVAAGKFTAADLIDGQTVTTVQGDEVSIEMIDGEVFLNGNIKVSIADIEASNGIVHVIEGVLLPPADLQSIVEIAVATPELSTLVGALQVADLVDTLNGEGPFTVFAPTNDAFDALDAIPQGEALTEVLLYHVAAGKFTAADLLAGQTVATVQGDEVTIEMINGEVFLNEIIRVDIADIEASNGVVHVINGVLIPPSL